MFKLVICDDEGKTTIVPLIRDEVTIGRKEGNTIRLTDRNVSRHHARLIRAGEDSFTVEDQRSRNGTKVNGISVAGNPSSIRIGDQLGIGDYSLSIRTDVSAGVPMGRQMGPGDDAGIGRVTPHARLVILTGAEAGRDIDLTVDLYVIGRSEEANLRVNDQSISRAHARMDGEEHKWTISDLDSINGILINGIKKDDYLLKSGDIIELGNIQFRFVAPGEPYEFSPTGSVPSMSPVAANRPSRLVITLASVAIVAVFVVLAVLFFGQSEGNGGGQWNGDSAGDKDQFGKLVEKGKDKMQAEEWEESARAFAEALNLEPDNASIKELKRVALSEMEAQENFIAALKSEQAQEWAKAIDSLAKISRSSHYYDRDKLKTLVARRCDELLDKAAFIFETNARNVDEIERVLEEIEELPVASADCRSGRDDLVITVQAAKDGKLKQRHINQAKSRRNKGGSQSKNRQRDTEDHVKKETPSSGTIGGIPTANPYATDDEKPQNAPTKSNSPGARGVIDDERPPSAGNISWDPLSEANAAVGRGDNSAAIRILEKGGNSAPVLSMLAGLYKKKGKAGKYEAVAKKFIRLYPNHKKSDRFRKDLRY